MSFPRQRFQAAGANACELTLLEEQYAAQSPAAQDGLAEIWAGLALEDLRGILDTWREDERELRSPVTAQAEKLEPPAAAATPRSDQPAAGAKPAQRADAKPEPPASAPGS